MVSKLSAMSKLSRFLSKNNYRLVSRTLTTSQSSKENVRSDETLEIPEHETHFGFQTVRESEKEEKVYNVFENVASTYDLMNDVMSGGIHRVWKDMFMERFSPMPGTKLIDVAGGTGDIAFRFLKYTNTLEDEMCEKDLFDYEIDETYDMAAADIDYNEKETGSSGNLEDQKNTNNDFLEKARTHVTICDINQAMLDVGKEKSLQLGYKEGISWVQGNAECLPMEDNSFDAYTVAFGIRNCTHIDKVLSEAFRVLKPGGRFMCLEFSQVTNPLLRSLYDSYSLQVIPVMGQVVAGDWKSYQYLVESIRKFPDQEDFADMIRAVGFSAVSFENLTFGVSAIHSAFKL